MLKHIGDFLLGNLAILSIFQGPIYTDIFPVGRAGEGMVRGDLARKRNIPVFWRGKTAKGEKLLQ